MARKNRSIYIYAVVFIFFFASLYHNYIISPVDNHLRPLLTVTSSSEDLSVLTLNLTVPPSIPPHDVIATSPFPTTSILLPDWEVLVIVSPEETPSLLSSLPGHADEFVCVHYTKEVTPARPYVNLSFPHRATFRCLLPERAHRSVPFKQPALFRIPVVDSLDKLPSAPVMLSWTNLVYDSLTTNYDVVLFVKGVIKKQDTVREPSEFRCIFGDDVINGVRTAVTTSTLEVFRCQRPKLKDGTTNIKVSLEILTEKRVVPTVAYYNPTQQERMLASPNGKSVLCACTMVYNVAKFLREWIYYHSKIGVERFLLYDNGSDDDLRTVVEELNKEGYDVTTYFWLWPKTQEAGFSHGALYANTSCTWMMYIDVDEFIYSPSWLNNTLSPSKTMLQSLLHRNTTSSTNTTSSEELRNSMTTSFKLVKHSNQHQRRAVGQLSVWCTEFGPSNQTKHPISGVIQGYNCKVKTMNRHKSIVLLEAIDDNLFNVIHHFKVKSRYKTIMLNSHRMVVNHYKYQAWPEFKTKFKRRVSAYVVDWTKVLNLKSQDRPRGLGSSAIEPKNWVTRYCDIYDNNLKNLTKEWFGIESPTGYQMPWQR